MTQNEILKRLVYIKHLYKQGMEQSKFPETINYSCILSFHDAIDWFMNLACLKRSISDSGKLELLNANRGNKKQKATIALMDYFIILPDLQISSEVEKINKLRNALKHDFVLPAKVGISESINTSSVFFETNTKIIFDLNFSEISLTDLLSNSSAKSYLKNAESNIQASKFESAFEEIAKAYHEIIKIDDQLFKDKWAYWSSNYKKLSSHRINTDFGRQEKNINSLAKNVKEIADNININLGRIDESIKVLSLGLDYRKYRKLMSLIPFVFESPNGLIIASKPKYDKKELPANTQFAFDFVLECGLKIQEFSVV
jgi:hypothetical protein